MVRVAEGRPFGEQLICLPVKGAEAMKNKDCRRAHSWWSFEIWSQNLTIAAVSVRKKWRLKTYGSREE